MSQRTLSTGLEPTNQHHVDVVVVGARVAGAATALLLARAGYQVVIIDRVEHPADTLSTHICAPAAQVMWRRWGLHAEIVRSGPPPTTTARVAVDGMAIDVPWPSDAAPVDALHHPRRNVLDPIILGAAVDAGACFVGRTSVERVIRDGERAGGVVVRDRHGRRAAVKASYVVGADGWRSRLARELGAATYDAHPVTNATYYGYWDGLDGDGLELFLSTGGRMAGTVPTNGATCVFVNSSVEHATSAGSPGGILTVAARIAPELALRLGNATPISLTRGTQGLPSFKRVPRGPGWLLVGDAGCTKDPISAHGIADALVSAELAARALHETMQGRLEVDAFHEYHDLRDEYVRDVFDATAALARYGWSTDEAWELQGRLARAWVDAGNWAAGLPVWHAVPRAPASRLTSSTERARRTMTASPLVQRSTNERTSARPSPVRARP
jgi:flavin-dependent dehydrogenase